MTTNELGIIPNNSKTIINIEDFLKKNCSYLFYGDTEVNQAMYYCSICDPKSEYPICKDCVICHKECELAGARFESTYNYDFVCHCGKELRHEVRKLKENCCNIYPLQNDKYFYSCLACGKIMCYFCHSVCHSDCGGPTCHIERIDVCGCKSDNHNLNDYVFRNEEGLKVEKLLTDMNLLDPYQLLFSFFNVDAMDNLCEFIKSVLDKTLAGVASESEKYKLGDILWYLWQFTHNNRNHYFHEKLKSTFSHQFMTTKALEKSLDFFYEYTLYFYFIFELKNDFKFQSKLSSYDFHNTSVTERLQNKELLMRSVPVDIRKKYEIYDFDKGAQSPDSLVNLVLKIANMLDKDEIQNFEIEGSLQIIEFCLKIHVFSLQNLVDLISILYKKYDHTIHYKVIKTKDFDSEILIVSFTKILFLIAMNYNDIIIRNIMHNVTSEYNFFIHQTSDFGIMLLKMCLKNCVTFSNNFKLRTPMLSSKAIILNNETLKLFIISNNDYMNNIEKMRLDGLGKYYSFTKIVHDINVPENQKNDSDHVRLCKIFDNLNEHLLHDYKDYYEKPKGCAQRENKINSHFEHFVGEFSKWVESHILQHVEETPAPDSTQKDLNDVQRFVPKLNKFNSEQLPFTKSGKFMGHIDTIITTLKVSNIIETVTHLLTLKYDVPHAEAEYERLIKYITGFLSLFLYHREGVRFIFKGKTLKRVNKLFTISNNRKRLLDFYNLLFKAVNTHGLFMVNCVMIPLMCGTIVDYLLTLTPKDVEFKPTLNKTIKIINYLSKYFDYEEQKSIINLIFTFMKESNLLNLEAFSRSLSQVKETKNLFVKKKTQFLNQLQSGRINSQCENDNESDDSYRNKYLGEFNTESNNLLNGKEKPGMHNALVDELVETGDNFFNPRRQESTNQKESRINDNFYFALFKLFSNNIFYVLNYERFKDTIALLRDFNNLETFKDILSSNYLNFYERSYFLKYIVSFYFMDIIKTFDMGKFLTTQQYQEIREKNNTEYAEKSKIFEDIVSVIDIFIQEFENMFYWIQESNSNTKAVQKYINNLLLIIKFISEYFFEKKRLYQANFSNHMTIQYYRFAKAFLKQAGLVKLILESCSKHDNFESFKLDIMTKYKNGLRTGFESKHLKTLEKIESLFDNNKIFEALYTEIIELGKLTDLFHEYDIQKNLNLHDKKVNLNFFTVGLIFQGEYSLIYEEYTEKRNAMKKKYYDATVNDIYNKYLAEFFDIKNTNFLTIMGIISSEDTNNYRNLLASYFINYINSNKYINERFDLSILLLTTKLLFFDTTSTQDALKELLQEDKNFFPNFYCQLNRFITLSYTTAKNFSMQYKYFNYINLKAQLMLQFLQLLAEGFSMEFKDRIMNPIESNGKTEFHIFSDVQIYELFSYNEEDIKGGKNKFAVLNVVKNYFSKIKKLKDEEAENIVLESIEPEGESKNGDLLVDEKEVKLEESKPEEEAKKTEANNETKDVDNKVGNVVEQEQKRNTQLSEAIKDKIVDAVEKYVAAEEEIAPVNEDDEDKCSGNISMYDISEKDEEEDQNRFKEIIAYKKEYDNLPPIQIKFYEFSYSTLTALKKYLVLNSQLPYSLPNDNLIILCTNLFNFLMEYNGIVREEDKTILALLKSKKGDKLWLQIKRVIFNREEGFSKERYRQLRFMKINYLKFLISLMQNENFKDLLPIINKRIGLINVYEEIIFYMNGMLKDLIRKGRVSADATFKHSSSFDYMKHLYIHSPTFQRSQKLLFSITAFRYIKIIGDIYKVNGIELYYEKNQAKLLDTLNKKDSNETVFNSLTGYNVYKFLSMLVVIVEVRLPIQFEEDKVEYSNRTLFFVRPAITFLLSEQTKAIFEKTVDRTSGSTKLNALYAKADYFIYEMFYNYNRTMKSKISRLVKIFRMDYLEFVNYGIILIHQIILIAHFYRQEYAKVEPPGGGEPVASEDPDILIFSDSYKSEVIAGNFALALIHIFYVAAVICLWVKYYGQLTYQEIVMKNHNIKFLITGDESKKKVKFIRFTDNFTEDNKDLLNRINDEITVWEKIVMICTDLTIYNRAVNMFILTFICLLIYLCSNQAIFLVFPVLVIANQIELLSSIFYAVQLKWKQLVMVLLFTYMLVYFFGWLSFFYMYHVYNIEDAYVIQTEVIIY
jgi:hypothetical protein